MTRVRGILIDPYTRSIEEVQIERANDMDLLEAVRAHIGTDELDAVRVDEHDVAWVDDRGLLKEGVPVFRWGDYPHTLAGKVLILGADRHGNDEGALMALSAIRRDVRWSDEETTGHLGPSTGEGGRITLGDAVLRPRRH